MSNENLNWEIATKDNLTTKISRNPMLMEKNKKQAGQTYGLGSIAIAVLFVGVVIFIEKRPIEKAFSDTQQSTQNTEIIKKKSGLNKAKDKIFNLFSGVNSFRSIEIENNQIKILIGTDNFFTKAQDQTINLTGTAKTVLTQIANESLKINNKFNVEVKVHTDSRKVTDKVTDHYSSNWELTAIMSAKILNIFEQVGFSSKSLSGSGVGSSAPFVPNKDINGKYLEKNLKLNRRVEILIY